MAAERKVQAYVYDLTQGMARQLSPMLLGQQIEGVWHTGLVVDGTEYFFGYGINRCRAGCTPFGMPAQVLDIGSTEVPPDMVEQLLSDMAPRYRPQDYNLLFNNCNHFANELALLLAGEGLPEHIMAQAQLVLNTPLGQMFMPMIMQMEGLTGNATATGFNGPSGTSTPAANTTTPATTAVNATAAPAATATVASPSTTAASPAAEPVPQDAVAAADSSRQDKEQAATSSSASAGTSLGTQAAPTPGQQEQQQTAGICAAVRDLHLASADAGESAAAGKQAEAVSGVQLVANSSTSASVRIGAGSTDSQLH